MGLYGEIIVDPAGPGYWPQVNREIPLILDDVLITEDGHRRVGGDSGRYEREDSADTVMLAPSETAIVDVLFDTSGDAVLEHRTPDHAAMLATFTVGADPAEAFLSDAYRQLRSELQLR